MISRAEYIQQPYSGEYIEKIYDIKSPWNSTDWTWIKFTEEDDIWCGEFRCKYRGVSCSTTLGIKQKERGKNQGAAGIYPAFLCQCL